MRTRREATPASSQSRINISAGARSFARAKAIRKPRAVRPLLRHAILDRGGDRSKQSRCLVRKTVVEPRVEFHFGREGAPRFGLSRRRSRSFIFLLRSLSRSSRPDRSSTAHARLDALRATPVDYYFQHDLEFSAGGQLRGPGAWALARTPCSSCFPAARGPTEPTVRRHDGILSRAAGGGARRGAGVGLCSSAGGEGGTRRPGPKIRVARPWRTIARAFRSVCPCPCARSVCCPASAAWWGPRTTARAHGPTWRCSRSRPAGRARAVQPLDVDDAAASNRVPRGSPRHTRGRAATRAAGARRNHRRLGGGNAGWLPGGSREVPGSRRARAAG